LFAAQLSSHKGLASYTVADKACDHVIAEFMRKEKTRSRQRQILEEWLGKAVKSS
jgi:hypothetical protein